MTPQELKNSILQLAIQGKLVEQRPEEGNAWEVYKQIRVENLKWKQQDRINENDIPFEIPENWFCVKLGNCLVIERGGSPRPIKDFITSASDGINWIKIGDTDKGGKYINSTQEKIIPEGLKKSRFVRKGDFLLSNSMSFGRPYILNIDGCIHDGWLVLRPIVELFHKDYLYYLLSSPMVFCQFCSRVAGAVVNNLNSDKVAQTSVPVPPLAEQKRIVAKIEELLPYIDRYEQAWSKLEDFNKRFPTDMQKSILQMAIQGKLVEQRPEEGTGEELYRQIQAEKQKLIKAGKIKKEKPLPEISEEEKPFDIPESWKWIRLGSILTSTDAGKSPQCNDRPRSGNEWGVIKTTAVQDGYFLEEENKVLPIGFEIQKSQVVHSGDLIITRAGPKNRTGVMCVVDKEPTQIILSDKTVRLSYMKGMINPHYLRHALSSPAMQYWVVNAMTGMAASQVNISQDKMRFFILPIPPLAEQKRIVARLEEILPLCEKMK